jgi:hypothetical protein
VALSKYEARNEIRDESSSRSVNAADSNELIGKNWSRSAFFSLLPNW